MVTVSIKVNGRKLPPGSGFPYRQFIQTVQMEPAEAEKLVDGFRELAKRKPCEKKDATEEPFPQT